jgi:L,D-transpeptidase-like protein/putative peptidoglycan binding protein
MKRRPLLVLVLMAAAAVAPAAAHAQLPAQPTPPPPPPAPAPPPAAGGKMSISVKSGLPTRRSHYVARGQRVLVVGRVATFVAGQLARVRVVRKGKVVVRRRTRIKRSRKGGQFVVRFVARKSGALRIVSDHQASPQQAASRARSARVNVVRWRAGAGAGGTKVLLLQRELLALGYATPLTGSYDDGTSRAVLAFRKVNNLGRDGFASAGVYDRLLRRKGAFRLRHPKAGKHVEFDWSHQVVVLAQGGKPWRVYHASSGKPSTPTVFGTFRFYSKTPGTNAKGMVDSNYFIRGYAIHGYPEVPTYAASHGCIRVPIPNAAAIFAWIKLGDPIFAYR